MASLLAMATVVGLACRAAEAATQSFTLTPSVVAFGDQTLLTQRTKSFGPRNTGTQALSLNSVQLTGPHSALFTTTNNCGASVAVAATCRINVTFRPTSVGAKSAAVQVVAGGSLTRTGGLTGTGVVAQFSIAPTSLSFGSVQVNTTSAARDVAISNTGTGILPVQSIKLGGASPGQFAVSHDCPFSVAVGGSCIAHVVFRPVSTGNKTATLVVTPQGGAAAKSVALSGVGEGAAPGLPTDTTSSRSAYVVPTSPGWAVVPLLTVGDNPQGVAYPMVGKPDGLGAIKGRISSSGEILEPGRYLTVFMNHELAVTRGVVRAHGTAGAFVSQWTLDLNTLRVVDGRDLIARTFSFTGGAWNDSTGTLAFDRLCSADLPAAGAFFNAQNGNGFSGRLFMSGEEAGTEGRAFAHIITGTSYGESYELPHLGKYQRENVVSNPKSGERTLVVGMDDSTPGQVYVYVGTKTNSGNAVQRAGLHGGRLYGIRVIDGGANYGGGAAPLENNGPIRGRFDLVDVTAYAPGLGTALQDASVALGVTEFARPEDGAWDTVNARSFYWATTGAVVDGSQQSARLYKVTFDSLTQPTGGTIDVVVDSATLTGSDGQKARGFDNITVNGAGSVVVQEDGGDKDYIAKIWHVNPATGSALQILESDRNRFVPGAAGFLTQAEENSGVIEITSLVSNASWYEAGRRYYLGTNQAHYFTSASLVEGGQLYLFASPP